MACGPSWPRPSVFGGAIQSRSALEANAPHRIGIRIGAMNLDRPRVRAPEFPEAVWINTLSQPSPETLRGRPVLILPDPLRPIRPEDASGAAFLPSTRDLEAEHLGDPFPPSQVPTILEAPAAYDDGRIFLEGLRRRAGDGFSLAGDRGRVCLSYNGAVVSAVVSSTPEPMAVAINRIDAVEVQLTQDDEMLPTDRFAEDTSLAADRARVRVDVPRLYRLVFNPDDRPNELRLEARGPGLTVYAFSFDPPLSPDTAPHVPIPE